MARVIFTGSRGWPENKIWLVRARVVLLPRDAVVVQGMAPGVDLAARAAALVWGMDYEDHPIDRRRLRDDPTIGHRRNQEIVDAGAELACAFMYEGSSGTADCARRARRAGIPVELYRLDAGVLSARTV